MTEICLDCPNFMIGLCKDIKNCPYENHDKCPDNYLCINEFCMKGHGITLVKRELINKIYTEFYNNNFDDSDIQCEYPLNCFSENCIKSHYVDFKYRKVISNIINLRHDDTKAIEIFNNFKETLPPKKFKPTVKTTTIRRSRSWADIVSPVSSPISDTKSDLAPEYNIKSEINMNSDLEDDDLDVKLLQLSQDIKESKVKIKETEEYISNLHIEYNKKIKIAEQQLDILKLELANKKQESKQIALEFIEHS